MTHPFARAGRELVPGHWFGPAAVLAVGCAIAWSLVGFGHGVLLALAVVLGFLFVALWNSPLRVTGHEPLQAVRALASARNAVVVLWRPGCPYSAALRRRASREGLEVHWVNIWRDEDAYELCCQINGGSEETPTAMLLDPALATPVVIPASVPGIREATASPITPTQAITPIAAFRAVPAAATTPAIGRPRVTGPRAPQPHRP